MKTSMHSSGTPEGVNLKVTNLDVNTFPTAIRYFMVISDLMKESAVRKFTRYAVLAYCVAGFIVVASPGPNAVMEGMFAKAGIFPPVPDAYAVEVQVAPPVETGQNTTNSPTGYLTGEMAESANQTNMKVAGFNINGGYRYRGHICETCSELHMAVDVGTPQGTPLHAIGLPGSKVYVKAFTTSGGGNQFVMYSPSIPGVVFLGAHMSEVNPGEYNPGEIFGKTGNTGTATTGAHLHIEQRVATFIKHANGESTDIPVTDPGLKARVEEAEQIVANHGGRARARTLEDMVGLSDIGVKDGKDGDVLGLTRVAIQKGYLSGLLTGNLPGNPADPQVMTSQGKPAEEIVDPKLIASGFYGGAIDKSKQPIIVLHETVVTADQAVKGMMQGSGADPHSYHAIIKRDGTVVYIVPWDRIAYGAGESEFNGQYGLTGSGKHTVNTFAYQISFESDTNCGPDKPGTYDNCSYTQEQYRSAAWVIRTYLGHVPLQNITTHTAVDIRKPKERFDPRGFDMAKFNTMLQATQKQVVK